MTPTFARLVNSVNAGAAAFVMRAILFSLLGIILLVALILLRRAIRRRKFDRLDAARFYYRGCWGDVLAGAIPAGEWRSRKPDAEVVETLAFDRLETAGEEESAALIEFLRRTGLLDWRIGEARGLRGWRREAALVRLGRTRAPEAVWPLAEALDDPGPEIRRAAVRGLGRTGLPSAAEAILERLVADELARPGELALAGNSLGNALIACLRSRPSLLLPYLRASRGATREYLARVMAEIASPELGDGLLLLATDPLPEVRASAARALAHTDFNFAFPALAGLASDEEWFVRLRAVTSLGVFVNPRVTGVLLRAVCDKNRLVRQRAAEALARLPDRMGVLEEVRRTEDRYALQAMIAELDRNGEFERLLKILESPPGGGSRGEAARLLQALEAGAGQLRGMLSVPLAAETERRDA